MLDFERRDLEEILQALHSKHEAIDEHIATVEQIAKELEAGQTVPMFAPGEGGVRAAKDMIKDFRARSERLAAIIKRINDELYGHELDD